MKVIDLIHSNKKTAFSFEILPPLKGTGIEKLYQTIDTLREFDPKYINITTHRSEYSYKNLSLAELLLRIVVHASELENHLSSFGYNIF